MTPLPDRATAIARNWRYQVDWSVGAQQFFVRVSSGRAADSVARRLRREKLDPVVTDLFDALQISTKEEV